MKNNRTPAIAFSVSAIAVAFLLEATTYPVPLGVGQFNPVSYVLDSTSFWPADKRIPNRYVASGWIGEHISARTLSLGCANIQASKINAFLAWSARHCGNPVRNHEYTLVAHAGKERHLTWRVPQLERELQRQMAGSDIESAYRVLDRRFKALGFTFMRARMIRRGDMTSSLTEKIA